MKTICSVTASFILFCLLATGCLSTGSESPLYAWRVQSGDSTVYLCGSVHVLDEQTVLPDAVMAAFDRSNRLAVEVDVTDEQAVSGALAPFIQQEGLYTDGRSVLSRLSPESAESLAQTFSGLEGGALIAQYGRPWLIQLIMAELIFGELGLNPEWGVDMFFIRRAHERGMEVVELEGMESQLRLFADADEELLIRSFEYSFRDYAAYLDESANGFREMVRHWRNGDPGSLHAFVMENGSNGTEEEYRAAVAYLEYINSEERNRRITDRIEELFSRGGESFVVVGALHFAGPGNILEILAERGYIVEQLPRVGS